MSIASLNTPVVYAREGPYYLGPFDRLMAPMVAGWAHDPRELFWLAPSTTAPLTAAKVVGWVGADGGPRLLRRDDVFEPLGYLELNPMPGQADCYWLGHCVIRPEQRGQGLGRMMIELALAEAFAGRQAHRVSLMVFPENLAAYHCYLRVGFREAGQQYKQFGTVGRRYRMIHMAIGRDAYELSRRGRSADAISARTGA